VLALRAELLAALDDVGSWWSCFRMRRRRARAHALQELHQDGSVSVYGASVLYRDPNGSLSMEERADSGPLGLGVGALVGGLIGLFGGPVGAVVGLAGGAIVGSVRDVMYLEVSDEFARSRA
jgi:uncharacterized membrane protein